MIALLKCHEIADKVETIGRFLDEYNKELVGFGLPLSRLQDLNALLFDLHATLKSRTRIC